MPLQRHSLQPLNQGEQAALQERGQAQWTYTSKSKKGGGQRFEDSAVKALNTASDTCQAKFNRRENSDMPGPCAVWAPVGLMALKPSSHPYHTVFTCVRHA